MIMKESIEMVDCTQVYLAHISKELIRGKHVRWLYLSTYEALNCKHVDMFKTPDDQILMDLDTSRYPTMKEAGCVRDLIDRLVDLAME